MRAPHRALAAASVTLLALVAASPTARADGSWSRHPQRADGRRKPASVPTDYVFTHNGFLHPSCVYRLQPGESVARDLTIVGVDGAAHDRIEPCPYARYDLGGHMVTAGDPPHRVHKGGGGGTYDGWLLSYSYPGSVSSGSNLSTKWIVPTPPTEVSTQDIAFFNDLETNTAIVQPVLDFSELPGTWAMEAESLVGNNDVQSTLVAVEPGDLLLGTVTSADCDSSGVCQSWTITLTDTTTGKSTTQTTMAVTDAPNEVDAAVLETYDVDSCARLPASGEVPFLDNSLTTSTGATEPETYTFYSLAQNMVNAEVPTTCGWNGTTSGNDYTLIFGANPSVPGDAGLEDDGSASSSSSGSSGSSSGSSGGGSGSSSSSSGGGSGSSGGGGSGSSSGAASSSGSGSSGGSHAGDGGASNGDANGNFGNSSSGCSCATVPSGEGRLGLALGLGLAAAAGLRRRRR
jgi:MYXO-CTERM domain-containing protein